MLVFELKAESLIFCKIFVFISEIPPGEDDYDVRLTIFISSDLVMGVMKLSVMSVSGSDPEPISRIVNFMYITLKTCHYFCS